MSYRKEIATAVGTLACAVGIGFVMQSTESAQSLYGPKTIRPQARAAAQMQSVSSSMLDVEAVTLTAAEYTPAPVTQSVADDPMVTPAVVTSEAELAPDAAQAQADAPDCDITANARPIAAAMVKLTMKAPCHSAERVTVHHSGMIFSSMTDQNGALDLTVPALAKNATFVLAFSSGDGGVAQADIEDIDDFDRVVVQWKGDTGFEVHAREFGADYGDAGHVWSGQSRDLGYAAAGQGGFITRLGDAEMPEGLIAEVYTFPTRNIQNTGLVDLSVETEVSSINCGAEIEAQTMQMRGGDQIVTRNLTLSVPECDAVGSFLVLNNLLEDLKVAGN